MDNKHNENKKDLEETERAYKYFKHADDHYATRINFFLVAESMLVISFVTIMLHGFWTIGIAISLVGIIFTCSWLYTNARLEKRFRHMIEKYLRNDPLYKDYYTSAGGKKSTFFLTYMLPISIILLWIFFICTSININPLAYIFIFAGILSIFSIWMNYFHVTKSPESK